MNVLSVVKKEISKEREREKTEDRKTFKSF